MPIAGVRSVRPSASGAGLFPQRLSFAIAAPTSSRSGTTGRNSQAASALLAITSPFSSRSRPVAPAPTRSRAAATACWTRSSDARERMTPFTFPSRPTTGTE
jgi:hypothetical protein